jgi:hypothetical protein
MMPPLTDEEAIILEQLVTLSGGLGCMKERSALTRPQMAALKDLKHKGYVMLTEQKFLVVHVP